MGVAIEEFKVDSVTNMNAGVDGADLEASDSLGQACIKVGMKDATDLPNSRASGEGSVSPRATVPQQSQNVSRNI